MNKVGTKCTAAVLDGLIYTAGYNDSLKTSFFESYDPKTDVWTVIKEFNKFYVTCLVPLNGFVYAFSYDRRVRQYDPEKNVLSEVGAFRELCTNEPIHSQSYFFLLQIRSDIDGAVREAIAVDDSLFVVTRNGSFGYVTVDERGKTMSAAGYADTFLSISPWPKAWLQRMG